MVTSDEAGWSELRLNEEFRARGDDNDDDGVLLRGLGFHFYLKWRKFSSTAFLDVTWG